MGHWGSSHATTPHHPNSHPNPLHTHALCCRSSCRQGFHSRVSLPGTQRIQFSEPPWTWSFRSVSVSPWWPAGSHCNTQHTNHTLQLTCNTQHTNHTLQLTCNTQHPNNTLQLTCNTQHPNNTSQQNQLSHTLPILQTRQGAAITGLYFRDCLLFCIGEHTHTHTHACTHTHLSPPPWDNLHTQLTRQCPFIAFCSPHPPPPPPPQVCLCKGKVLPEEDTVVEGVGLWGTGAQAAAVGDHVLHPLQQRVQAQQSRLRHLLHKIGIFHRVARIRQRQTHAWPTSTPAYNSNSTQL